MGFLDSSASLLATCGGDTVKLFDVKVDAGDPCTLSYTPSPGSQVNSAKWNHTRKRLSVDCTSALLVSEAFVCSISAFLRDVLLPFICCGIGNLLLCVGSTLFELYKGISHPCLVPSEFNFPMIHYSSLFCPKNLVVASDGDDKKISLWNKYGQNMGSFPSHDSDIADDIEESINCISFSNKSSRYLCSGGSDHIVKIWDLQRKRCIKRLSGHTDTITGVMYNCKDEHLASINEKGDLIRHNLASGARAAELKDPHGQVLRVLDYSRFSQHLLSTTGDEGSVHIWDTTGRSPKVSLLKQHSAPTTGICFSPSSDKIIVTVGLGKKLYMFDSGTKRPSYWLPFEALAYSDDGNLLAAGTTNGRVVFYNVRGKPQPFTVLRAYSSSGAIMNLCWQRTKPVVVNEKNCTAESALLGGSSEDSVLMPDPLPSVAVSKFSSTSVLPSLRASNISGSSISITSNISAADETPHKSRLWTGGTLPKLQAPRSSYDLKDDMDVFSPLVDVQPITPSLGSWWNDNDEMKKDQTFADKKSTLFSSSRRYPLPDGTTDSHPISDWRSIATSRQDDNSPIQPLAAKNFTSTKSEIFIPQPPGNALPDKSTSIRPPISSSRFLPSMSLDSGAISAGSYDSSSSVNASKNSLISPAITSLDLQNKIFNDSGSASLEPSSVYIQPSTIMSSGTKTIGSLANPDFSGTVFSSLPRRLLASSERTSSSSIFSDSVASAISSPKSKKTGQETKEELVNSLLSRQDASASVSLASGSFQASNVAMPQPSWSSGQSNQQTGASSFSLQLAQRSLEETLESAQNPMLEAVRNVHIEILRQFHIQEMETFELHKTVLEKLEELMKEVQSLRRENQQLRQIL